eukprot:11333164-Prorocentrum_lima.AAC.1
MRRQQCRGQIVRRIIHGEVHEGGNGSGRDSPTVNDLSLDSNVTGGLATVSLGPISAFATWSFR